MESLWSGIKIPDDSPRGPHTGEPLAEFSSLSLNSAAPSRQRVASPLRHPLEPMSSTSSFLRTTPRVAAVEPPLLPSALKTPSVHAAQKWGGRTAEKLFPHQTVNGTSPEAHAVNVPGVAWRRMAGDTLGTVGRGELSTEDVRRIKEEEEGTQFSME